MVITGFSFAFNMHQKKVEMNEWVILCLMYYNISANKRDIFSNGPSFLKENKDYKLSLTK